MVRVRPLSLLLAALAIACSGSRPEPQAGRRFRQIRACIAWEMLSDNPDLIVLDVRPFTEYAAAQGHLGRAVSVPFASLDQAGAALEIDDDDTVLVYDGQGGERQQAAVLFLIERGQRYVVQIEGGLEGWLAGGFAVVVEDAPLSPVRLR